MLKELLDDGAVITLINHDGNTCVEFDITNDLHDLFDTLLEYRAAFKKVKRAIKTLQASVDFTEDE
jgi:ankyrin repeat protein